MLLYETLLVALKEILVFKLSLDIATEHSNTMLLPQGNTNKSWKSAEKGGIIFDKAIQMDMMEAVAYKMTFKEWQQFSRCG